MPRCPKFLDVDGFDKLAASMNMSLSDNGVGALGEIAEHIAAQILEGIPDRVNSAHSVDIVAIVKSAENLGVRIDVDWQLQTIRSSRL
jgi:hypothetical protein